MVRKEDKTFRAIPDSGPSLPYVTLCETGRGPLRAQRGAKQRFLTTGQHLVVVSFILGQSYRAERLGGEK